MSNIASLQQTQAQQAQQTDAQKASASLATDFDNFLTILTTQLQNQDPLSPTDTNEFTNQIVQFSSLEQSINQNRNLENILSNLQGNQNTGAVGYIGKSVELDTNQFSVSNGADVKLSYVMPENAKSSSLVVYDEQDRPVAVIPAEKSAGTHQYTFDPTPATGSTIADGKYRFQIEASDANGTTIEQTKMKYRVTGTVTGVDFADGKTAITIGDTSTALDKILKVNEVPQQQQSSS